MKIVLISSGVLAVPPIGYGGLEQVVFDLAIELDKKGHEVFVVAPTESTVGNNGNIKLIDGGACNPNAHDWEQKAYEKYAPILLSAEFKGAVIHDHSWRKFTYLLKLDHPELNVMSTLHGMLPYQSPPPIPKPCMAGISKNHADTISAVLGIPVRYAYNGIDLDKYTPNFGNRTERFLFLARITPFKGTHVFVDAITQLGYEGDVVGDDALVEDKGYVERILQACGNNPRLRYWGGVPRDRAIEFFRNARCYVLPCTPGWAEPFGLTIVESMATGCCVVATASGAIPELIEHGKTGYVVNSLQDLTNFLTPDKIDAIKPEDCRARAEMFSREAMATNYERLYEECLNGGW